MPNDVDQFVSEVRVCGFNFTPAGWAQCNGQLLPISQNTALFSLLGTFYGGDGKSTFALPNLKGSCANSMGQGPGLTDYGIGYQGGSEFVTLLESEIPAHVHAVNANIGLGTLGTGSSTTTFARSVGGNVYKKGAANTALGPQSLAPAGGDQPHNNMMPYLVLNFVIALQGIFPARN